MQLTARRPSVSRRDSSPSSIQRSALTWAIIATFLSSPVGCTALHVTHRPVGSTVKPASVPGIPFFPKRARCQQQVVWFEPIYTLSLAALIAQKDGSLQPHQRGTVLLSRTNFKSQEVTGLVKLINEEPTDEGTVQRQWQKVVALADPQVLSRDFGSLSAQDLILAGRSATPIVYVDYADQYYVNAKVPLAGSANLDAKVANDGSLSELSGQVQNNTLATILSALPISSVVTGELGLAGTKGIPTVGQAEAFQLTISISGYLHTLSRLVDYPATSSPCPVANYISLTQATDYTRAEVSPTAAQLQKPQGADSNLTKDPSSNQQGQQTRTKTPQQQKQP